MRPFEAARRVYLVFGAAPDERGRRRRAPEGSRGAARLRGRSSSSPTISGPLPPTIRSRCQLVPFRRLSQRAVKAYLSSRGLAGEQLEALARVAGGRLDRADRLLDAEAGQRRAVLIELARSVYLDPALRPGGGVEARARPRAAAGCRGESARRRPIPRRTRPRGRRSSASAAPRGAPSARRSSTRWTSSPAGTGIWSSSAAGAERRSRQLRPARRARRRTASRDRSPAAERAAEAVRETWRSFEFQVQPGLALEACLSRLRRELAAPAQARASVSRPWPPRSASSSHLAGRSTPSIRAGSSSPGTPGDLPDLARPRARTGREAEPRARIAAFAAAEEGAPPGHSPRTRRRTRRTVWRPSAR